tara:strand:+ start:86 stop:352 length:267 start_codon:yes stop_codon:yes gene_type:complete
MTIATTILDFQLSKIFKEYESHMIAKEQQRMFKEMEVYKFYIGKSLDDPPRATVIFQESENAIFDIFMKPETKPIVEAFGVIFMMSQI